MRVAIVGAGVSGIVTAKYLIQCGHQVTVFEACPDIGGVWSRTRRYPGLETQTPKGAYHFSDFPMPALYPMWPSGEQVQGYLEAYVKKHNLQHWIRFNTSVVGAEPLPQNAGWRIRAQPTKSEAYENDFDHLVICCGIFSEPRMPNFPGEVEFVKGKGFIQHSSYLVNGLDTVQDKNVLILGYGKSACDSANAMAETARSTTMITRHLNLKFPHRIYGLPYQFVLHTRVAEALFEYIDPSMAERFFGAGFGAWRVRKIPIRIFEFLLARQLGLTALGLVPHTKLEDMSVADISLSPEGLYEKVEQGRIEIKRDCRVVRLGTGSAGDPRAILSDGTDQPCDIVVCATGFHQRLPFLPKSMQSKILDKDGNWLLYRHILPTGVPNLTFNGYNITSFSPLSSEAAAVWIAAHLAGEIRLPSEAEQLAASRAKLAFLEQRAPRRNAHGTTTVPFSLRTIDELLEDVGLQIGRWARLRQWFQPVNCADYDGLATKLGEKLQ